MPSRFSILRLLAAAPLCALCACASNSASKAELGALQAEVQSLRQYQARLLERLERLEQHETVGRARAGTGTPPPAATAQSRTETAPSPGGATVALAPELTVVKLKPRVEPAPKLPTSVPVVEPDSEQVEMFISAVPETGGVTTTGDDDKVLDQPDPEVLDAQFEQLVAMLRTGNVEGGVEGLKRFAEENPRHARADNALYFSGLGQIGLKDFATAARTFQRLIDSYPAGDAVLDGMLRLAECRVRLNQSADARALYTRVVTQFPGTAAATQAEQRLAALSP